MYYAFIKNKKIDGKGELPCSGDGITCVEITEEVYNNLERYMWNGQEIVENPNYEQEEYERQYEEVRQQRENAYMIEVDVLHAERQKNTVLGTWTEEDEAEYIQKVIDRTNAIKERYPYPTPPTE
ncbi:MAG: hypothetical protein J6S85_07230 [Methanobrevibacter sp.]|nr:hypothetical protein [Methanobrevibacter sp.]